MNVEVLNTGSELLLGNVVNTHLAFLGRKLFPLGLRIARQTTIPDGPAIRTALLEAFGRCDVLIVTGGLGPTTDDITREVAAELLGIRLAEDACVMEAIVALVKRRGFVLRDRMRRQAMVPAGATVLPNAHGTAPGLYLPAAMTPALATPHMFFLPGPPRELAPMFENHALPILRAVCGDLPERECRVYHVVGMGESAVEEAVGLGLSARGDVEVGYCARPNEVDLRLIGAPGTLAAVEPLVLAAVGAHLVSHKGEVIEEVVVGRLRELGKTVALAESCTGGLLAHRLTNVPGASEILHEGFVTYSNAAKIRNLGVPAALIAEHGAVSDPVARAMAEGVRAGADADFGIGITGIAGPGGGTSEKPVGLVHIALARRDGTTASRAENFPTDRETFKQLATQTALDLLRRELL
ncbi:MAG TPA: competence/damage-inducible protein A [Terrimicrobiaceae bacterium]|nr:competence/damage-inducible protein A [Terrimicrobiaceae bacterium]